jgi:hypothetical protein
MATFRELPEFTRELKKLSRKYQTLPQDIEDIKAILISAPLGISKNFTLIHGDEKVKVVKVRVHCESLRSRAMRMIYAYHKDTIEFMYIELYFKGDKENENREKIEEYLKQNK